MCFKSDLVIQINLLSKVLIAQGHNERKGGLGKTENVCTSLVHNHSECVHMRFKQF